MGESGGRIDLHALAQAEIEALAPGSARDDVRRHMALRLLGSGREAEAIAVIRRIDAPATRAAALFEMARATPSPAMFAALREFESALPPLDRARRYIDLASRIEPTNAAAAGECEMGARELLGLGGEAADVAARRQAIEAVRRESDAREFDSLLRDLAWGEAHRGNIENLRAMADVVDAEDFRDDILLALAHAFASQGRIEEAGEILRALDSAGYVGADEEEPVPRQTFWEFVTALARSRGAADAQRFGQSLTEGADRAELNRLVALHAPGQDRSRAAAIAPDLANLVQPAGEADVRARHIEKLASVRSARGAADVALFRSALAAAGSIADPERRILALERIIRSLLLFGASDEGAAEVRRLEDAAFAATDPAQRAALWTAVFKLWMTLDEPRHARGPLEALLRELPRIGDLAERVSCLADIAPQLEAFGLTAAGRKVAREIGVHRIWPFAQDRSGSGELVQIHLTLGDATSAHSAALKIADLEARATALIDVARSHAGNGDLDDAARALNEALAAGKAVPLNRYKLKKDEILQDRILPALVAAQAGMGMADAALATAATCDDDNRPSAFAVAAHALARAGRARDAIAAAQRIADPVRRAHAYIGMAYG